MCNSSDLAYCDVFCGDCVSTLPRASLPGINASSQEDHLALDLSARFPVRNGFVSSAAATTPSCLADAWRSWAELGAWAHLTLTRATG